jgi:hypothetical protein
MASSVESYLDESCARLAVNPAKSEDIREELRGHLQELVDEYVAEGLDRRTAIDRATSQFGDAHRVHHFLERVHRGDPWWVWRLKGMVLGALLGVIVSLLLPLGGHLEFVTRLLCAPAHWDPTRTQLAANGLIAGGLIGLLSGARGLFVGWVVGSLIWMAEYVAFFIISVATGMTPSDGGLHLFNSVLLSPVLGGLFGAVVGAGCSAILSATSRLRPEIR